ncbi:MAG: putative membrane protein [Flavobacteriales bacterium]|jgi:putative membrane protein
MLWVKSLHIISVVCWFASLFYLPRLFVYHAKAEDEISKKRFEIMEKKLYRYIGTPSMIATWIFGGWLVSYAAEFYTSGMWFHIKFMLVILLSAYHGSCGYFMKKLRNNTFKGTHVFFRFYNEIPVLFLIAIVILVEVQPM